MNSMENNSIEKLFDLIINDLVLNDHNMLVAGFNNEDIEGFIQNKIIEGKNDDKYRLLDVEKLRKYGIKLFLNGDGRKAGWCFRKCYEIAPNGRKICLQYFLSLIRSKNYSEAIKVYKQFAFKNMNKFAKDDNLYLYLLSSITELDDEYKDRAINMDESDILYTDYGSWMENNMRKAILQSKFSYAYKLILKKINSMREYSLKYEIMRILIVQALEVDKQVKQKINNLVINEKYYEIIKLLNNRKKQKKLSKIENYVYLIVTDIILTMNGESIKPQEVDSDDMIMLALANCQFEWALNLNREFLIYKGEEASKDIVHILLVKLKKLLSTNLIDESNSILDDEYEGFDLYEVEDMAYYIKENNMSIYEYVKKRGLFSKYILLIKLIFARDNYIDGDYVNGDKLINEVESSFINDSDVLSFLEEVKINRDNYVYNREIYVKKREI